MSAQSKVIFRGLLWKNMRPYFPRQRNTYILEFLVRRAFIEVCGAKNARPFGRSEKNLRYKLGSLSNGKMIERKKLQVPAMAPPPT